MAEWMKARGYQNIDADVAENTTDFGPRRFWLAPNKSTQVIFLDDNPIRYNEHNVCIDGSWQHWATCPGEDVCPLCAVGDSPRYVGVWSVIDRSAWKDKKGKEHKDELRLFVATGKVMTKLARRSEAVKGKGKKDGLVGLAYTVGRGGDLSPNTGDDFELVGKAKPEMLAAFAGKIPDYAEVLKPNTIKLNRYARKLANAGPPTKSGGKPGMTAESARAGDGVEPVGDDAPWPEA